MALVLLELGADVNHVNHSAGFALYFAAKNGTLNPPSLLLVQGITLLPC